MLNTKNVAKKLEILFDYYQLNASAFADKIGVQRSSLSHLLSGRNKPSLEFVMKVVETFPEVDLYWLLTNQGEFPSINSPTPSFTTLETKTTRQEEQIAVEATNSIPQQNESTISADDLIEKVMVFYRNGTVKSYRYKE